MTCRWACLVPGLGIGMVSTSVRAHGRNGRLNMLLALLDLMTWFRHTIVMWSETRCIIDRPRVMNRQVMFSPPRRLLSRPTMLVRTDMLSVEIGLLSSMSPGPIDSVCVTVTCRCRLLENRAGKWLIRLGPSLIRCTSLLTCLWTRLPEQRRIPTGLVRTLQTGRCGLSESTGLRKMHRMDECSLWCPLCGTPRLSPALNTLTLLLRGRPNLTTLTSAADPFELDLFMSVMALFLCMLSAMLLMVPILLTP